MVTAHDFVLRLKNCSALQCKSRVAGVKTASLVLRKHSIRAFYYLYPQQIPPLACRHNKPHHTIENIKQRHDTIKLEKQYAKTIVIHLCS